MTIDPEAKLAENINLRKVLHWIELETKSLRKTVPLMRNEEVIEYPCDQTTLTKRYTEEAVKFIEENKKRPFSISLLTMPHIPLFASEKFKGKSERGPYGDTIEEIDWSVGEIMKALRKNNLDENTLVVYTSDNGPWKLKDGRGGSANPLKGLQVSNL